MRVIFLGTGGFHPNARRHTACVLLPEMGVAFDAGTSAFRLAERVPGYDLHIFLSHAHLDHICGLTYLLVPLLQNQLRSCKVHGLPATLDAVREHLFSPPVFPVLPPFEFVPLSERVALPGGTLTWIPLMHPGGAIGYRIDRDDGQSLAYITDTYEDGSYLEFVRGVDVLIHECNFPDALAERCPSTGHSHTSQVARLAKHAGVGRLFLTHIDPTLPHDDPIDMAAARTIFPATVLAEDLLDFAW